MEKFCIKYSEMQTIYVAVEAEDETDALNRFDHWRMSDERVFDLISNSDMYSDSVISNDFDPDSPYLDEILTDEEYQHYI